MVHKEIAKYSPEFGDLEVEVVANRWYFPMGVKKDEVSKKIVFSKKSDYSAYFWPDVDTCFQSFTSAFDLICVIPASDIGVYSPTLIALAELSSKKYRVPFDNIVHRTIKPVKKMTECRNAIERCQVHKGTLALGRKLKPNEKMILLLDDVKAEGDTKLICAELLIKFGAHTVKAICLGINTSDTTKSNELG
jgi:predicted amidophosphoribosyltransferase